MFKMTKTYDGQNNMILRKYTENIVNVQFKVTKTSLLLNGY